MPRLNADAARLKHSDGNWSAVPNRLLEDSRLSWKAKALWAYLNSRPDEWIVVEEDLVARSTDGKAAVRSALRELEETGYLRRDQSREEGRYGSTEYWLTHTPSTDFQPTEKPATEKPSTENQLFSNTEETNTDDTNTHDRQAYARAGFHWFSLYPERDAPLSRATVIRQYIAARERGATESELIDAVNKYRKHIVAQGNMGTRYVLMPGRFLSDEVWRTWYDYSGPETKPDTQVSSDGLRFRS